MLQQTGLPGEGQQDNWLSCCITPGPVTWLAREPSLLQLKLIQYYNKGEPGPELCPGSRAEGCVAVCVSECGLEVWRLFKSCAVSTEPNVVR